MSETQLFVVSALLGSILAVVVPPFLRDSQEFVRTLRQVAHIPTVYVVRSFLSEDVGSIFTRRRPRFPLLFLPLLIVALTLNMNQQGPTYQEVQAATGPAVVSGNLKKWHPITLTFTHDVAPGPTENPFTDYRLQVAFQGPDGRVYDVPGYFDGDGNGSDTGNIWRVNFAPDQPGTWRYQASFRKGSNVAVDLSPTAGTPVGFDGAGGTFAVQDRNPNAPGFLKWGRLEYVGGHYLKFRDGSYWIKGGADSPENFLGYAGFDNTPAARHTFGPHIQDWTAGSPIFNTGSPDGGKGLIGAVNYLAAKNVNSVYFLPMNIGGDARDTSPYRSVSNWSGSSSNDNLRFDISKLAQWEKAFRYMQEKGIHLHFVLNEAEGANKRELDNATLGIERKLFYRELVARFGHHNALQWNISEEYDYDYALAPTTVKAFANYIRSIDPYQHPITVHQISDPSVSWAEFWGPSSPMSLTSFQFSGGTANHGAQVEKWRNHSAQTGKPMVISMDELRSTTPGNIDSQRKDILWPTYLSGGQLEWFMGGEDQSLENFRKFDALWNYTWYARKFMEFLPFWEMTPDDRLVSGATGQQVFYKRGQYYAIYYPSASSTGVIDLSNAPGTFEQRWFNPRTGNFEGAIKTVTGGGRVALGTPPSTTNEDWAVLLTETFPPTPTPTPTIGLPSTPTRTPTPTPTGTETPTPDPRAPKVTGFTLINADTGREIGPLVDGATVDFAAIGTKNINIRANTNPAVVGSVVFSYDTHADVRIENAAPYTIAGDHGKRYSGFTPTLGTHTVSATPFSAPNTGGAAGTPLTVSFTVIDTGSDG